MGELAKGILCGVTLAIALAFPIGGFIVDGTNSGWTRDCERIGAHLYANKVYECKVKP